MSFNYGTQDPYVKTALVGAAGGAVGSATVTVANMASGGAMAQANIDNYGIILLNQTTAGQTITLAAPTDTTAGKVLMFGNVGSQTFTYSGLSVTAGEGVILVWSGSAWICIGKGF